MLCFVSPEMNCKRGDAVRSRWRFYRSSRSPARCGISRCKRLWSYSEKMMSLSPAENRPFADYKPTVAFLFPGQGSQRVGMAKEVVETVPSAKDLFDRASEVLGYDLLKICLEGPEEKLNSTDVCQPAVLVTSLAAVESLRATQGQEAVDACDIVCGLSLGEYTALTFAGALSFEDSVDVIRCIATNSQIIADETGSTMISLIGLDTERAKELCLEASQRAGEGEIVTIANYLCPGNLTVAGTPKACEILKKIAVPEFKARLTVQLAIGGAFHTGILSPVAEILKQKLRETSISKPRIPVLSNVDARPHGDPDSIRRMMVEHIRKPVLWEASMKEMTSRGLVKSYELGPGNVLSGLFKRIDRNHPVEKIDI